MRALITGAVVAVAAAVLGYAMRDEIAYREAEAARAAKIAASYPRCDNRPNLDTWLEVAIGLSLSALITAWVAALVWTFS